MTTPIGDIIDIATLGWQEAYRALHEHLKSRPNAPAILNLGEVRVYFSNNSAELEFAPTKQWKKFPELWPNDIGYSSTECAKLAGESPVLQANHGDVRYLMQELGRFLTREQSRRFVLYFPEGLQLHLMKEHGEGISYTIVARAP